MSSGISDNKRILKNTIFLYLRMLVMLFVSLYTSRIVLQQLGFVDFGLYNVVGSLIMMFTFVQGSLTTAASRFLSYEIGAGTTHSLNKVFCMSMNIHLIFALIVLVFSQTVGLWYVVEKMTIPEDRFIPALITYEFSNLSALLAIIVIPYRSMIISQERMGAFAYISIYEALSKLVVAMCLVFSTVDKLVVYAVLLFLIQVSIQFIYMAYSRKHFAESRFSRMWDKATFRNMFSFCGWSVLSYSNSIVNQAINLLINAFFGPVVNAARAISYQVQSNVSLFSTNFQIALNPQIVKNYAAKQSDRVYELVQMSSKISFSLLLILMFALLTNIDYVLGIWLENVPETTALFVVLVCISSVFTAFCNPLGVVAEAANRLKRYNTVTMPYVLSYIPVAYVLLRLGMPSYGLFLLLILLDVGAFFVKLYVVKDFTSLNIRDYILLFLKCTLTVVLAVFAGYYLSLVLPGGFVGFVEKCAICCVSSATWIWFVIFDNSEREKVVAFLKAKLAKKQ